MENPSRPVTGYPAPNQNGQPQPPNVSYPYSAPPPSQPYQYAPFYSAQPPPPSRRATFLRTFLITMIAIAIIFGVILFIIWLVLRPRIPQFQLTSLSVAKFSANQSRLTANWEARFLAINPNKKVSVSYDDVISGIFYHSHELGRTQIPPFSQGTHDQTDLTARLSVVDYYVNEKVVNDMNKDRSSGSVRFDVSLEAITGFKYGAWRMRRKWLRVWCGDVAVNISSSGSGNLVDGTRKCRVAI